MQISGGRAFEEEGMAGAKALRQDPAWCVHGAVRRPVWPEHNERMKSGKRRGQEGDRALWAAWRTLVFPPSEVGGLIGFFFFFALLFLSTEFWTERSHTWLIF